MIELNNDALCFDDVLLVPQDTSVESRHSVDLCMNIGGSTVAELELPLIAAPMDTVCGPEMCIAMAENGGLGILHRYMENDEQLKIAKSLVKKGYAFGVAISSVNGYMNQAQRLVDIGVDTFCVDTANGHSHFAVEAVKNLRSTFGDYIYIMAGNVATSSGFRELADAGANSVRVGIGGGSACTTRIVSGHGVPTLHSIMDCAELKSDFDIPCAIIADGGIRNTGDMVKAFAAGANAVMVGSMLAGTDEAPGNVYRDMSGNMVKSFRGMASAEAQKDALGRVSVAEGVSTTVPYKGSVKSILDQVRGGLGSGCSYSGVHRLSELAENAMYVKVSPLSIAESKPHAL